MSPTYTYCELSEENLPEFAESLSALQSLLTPEPTIFEEWRWRYLEDPSGASTALIALRDGKPVGKAGVIATPLRFRDRIVVGGLVEGFVIDESARTWDCYRGLLAALFEKCAFRGIAFTFAQTPTEIMKLNCALGHQNLGRLPLITGVLSPRNALLARGAPAIAALAGSLVRPVVGLRAPRRSPEIETVRAHDFDARFDNVWAAARRQWPVAVIKDAAYLNWRYARRPNRRYELLTANRSGQPAGMLALLVRPESRDAFVMDLLAENDDPDVLRSLLRHGFEIAEADGVGLIRASFPRSSVECRILEESGFSGRFSSRWDLNFVIATLRQGAEALERDSGNWFTATGDWLHD